MRALYNIHTTVQKVSKSARNYSTQNVIFVTDYSRKIDFPQIVVKIFKCFLQHEMNKMNC